MVFESVSVLGLLPLRIALGVIFVVHGYPKFLTKEGFEKHMQLTASLGFPMPSFFARMSAIAEFVGGIALFVGLFTQVAALLIMCNMLVAIYAKKVVWNMPFAGQGGYEFDVVLFAAALTLFLVGAGAYSVDYFFSGATTLF